MSFSDRPTIPPLKAAGCLAYTVVATLVVFFFLIAGALGDCEERPDGSCVGHSGLGDFLMFPGSLIIAIVIGIFLARWAMRNESDD